MRMTDSNTNSSSNVQIQIQIQTQTQITNMDLYSNQYSEQVLISNIDNLSQHTIFCTQKNLTNNFIWNYLLNSKYNKFIEDGEIMMHDILAKYPNFRISEFTK